ncbi:MAG: cobalamin-dependent protein [Steroidobacteraceae bacterium]
MAQATGLSVQTLRAWERRYGLIVPARGVGGHRVYTADDVARLRRLREATACGHPISKIAHVSDEELARLTRECKPAKDQLAAAGMLLARILRAVDNYEPADCDQAIAMAFALLPPGEVVREVLCPALREVGARWHRGELSIGHERILSCAVRRQVMGMLQTFNGGAKGPTVVFATVSGEQHELGVLMYAALAASQSLRVDYLGADLPAEVIADHACRVGAAAVALSLVMVSELRRSLQQLAVLRSCMAESVEIWVGGPACLAVDPEKFPAGTVHLGARGAFDHRIALLAACGR